MSDDIEEQEKERRPKFGLLLVVLFSSVIFCVVLTYVMSTYFPNF